MSSSTTVLPTNDLASPPTSGPFQLVVHIIAKSDEAAETLYKMAKAVQKRALSDKEPKTIAYRVSRSYDDKRTILIVEEYEEADALVKTHKEGEEFKGLMAKAGDLVETMNARFYHQD